MKLNVTQQLLVYVDYVNIFCGSLYTVKKNTEGLLAGSKEIGLEENADKTKYMVITRDQNVGRSRSIKIDNSFSERVEHLKYSGTTLRNQNSIQEEINRTLKSWNAFCYSVHYLRSANLLSKNMRNKIYSTIVLPVDLYGCETWSPTLREQRRLRVFENRVLKGIIGP